MSENKHNHEPVSSGVIVGCQACHDEFMAAIALHRFYMAWAPIETAPKDGTWILLTGGEVDPEEWYAEVTPPAVVALWDEDRWSFCSWDGRFRSKYLRPTYWMPIPKPPE